MDSSILTHIATAIIAALVSIYSTRKSFEASRIEQNSKELTAILNANRDLRNALHEELQRARKEVDELSENLKNANKAIEHLSRELSNALAEIDRLKKIIEDLEG